MKKEIRLLEFNSKIPLSFSVLFFDSLYKHMHSYSELVIVLKGEFDATIGEKEYHCKEDDLFIVNPKVFHSFTSDSEAMVLSLFLDQKGFGLSDDEISSLAFNLNTMENGMSKKAMEIRNLAYSIIKYNSMENVNSIYTNRAIAFSLFAQLVNNFSVDLTESQKPDSQIDTFNELTSYINDHYKERLSLSSVAEKYDYSVAYLSRLFKKIFNTNFVDYYDLVRVNYSIDDLLSSRKTIEEIAVAHGFEESRSYVRAFRNVFDGMTPSEYRKEYRNQKSTMDLDMISKEALDIILRKYDEFNMHNVNKTGDARVVSEVVSIDYDDLGKEYVNPSSMLLDVGPLSVIIYSELREKIVAAIKTNNPKYMVLRDFFSPSLRLYQKENDVYRFRPSVLESILLFVNSNNILPYFRFEYDPKIIDLQSYFMLVKELLDWIVLSVPASKRVDWLFSFGYCSSIQEMNTKERYSFYDGIIKLYQNVEEKFHKSLLVSPSFLRKDVIDSDCVLNFIDYAKANGIFFDYMSYRYLDPQDSKYIQVSKNEFHDFIDFLDEKNLSLNGNAFIEQVNFSSEPRNLLNDTLFASTYFAKLLIDNSQRIKALTKSEFFDPYLFDSTDNPFFGGNGTITNDGIPKATYNMFSLASCLGERVLKKSKNFIVTENESKDIVILCNNYNHYAELYARREYYELSDRDRYACFPKSRTIQFAFTFDNIPCSTVRIKKTILSAKSGSVYDRALSIGKITELNRDERSSLKNLGWMDFSIEKKQIVNGSLELDLSIGPFETELIEIKLLK